GGAPEPGGRGELLPRCAPLPLALALVAARAAVRPHAGLGVLAEELRDTGRQWQALTGDDRASDVQAVLSWSYQTLTSAAARVFRLLGLHPRPEVSAAAAASLPGLPAQVVRPGLAGLTRGGLLGQHTRRPEPLPDPVRAQA